jgi:hypothetical protein
MSTAAPLSIALDPRAGWTLAGDWAVPSRFTAVTTVDGFRLVLIILIGDRGPQVAGMSLEHPQLAKGAPITQGVLRKVAIDRLVRQAVLEARQPAQIIDRKRGLFRLDGDGSGSAWGGRQIREGRGSRTAAGQLERVAAIYEAAVRDGRPPVKAVEKELPCSRSHAGRLVGQARIAGLLRTTSPGRASTVDIVEVKPDGSEPQVIPEVIQ